jgi:hypothetical protein
LYKLEIEGMPNLPPQDGGSMDNIDFKISNKFDFKEEFADLYDGVSYASKEEWMSSLALQDNDLIITSSELDNNNTVCHQVYVVITLASSEDLDSIGNPLVNPENITSGARYQASGTGERTTDDTSTTAQQVVWLTQAEWAIIRVDVDGTVILPWMQWRTLIVNVGGAKKE